MKKKRMTLARLLMIVKSRQIGLHNQNHRLKMIIEYCGEDSTGKDLFQIRDDLGCFYALQGALEQIEESLDSLTPMDISY